MDKWVNPTGVVVGGLTLSDIKYLIRDCEEPNLRERLYEWALCLSANIDRNRKRMSSYKNKLTISLALPDEVEEKARLQLNPDHK